MHTHSNMHTYTRGNTERGGGGGDTNELEIVANCPSTAVQTPETKTKWHRGEFLRFPVWKKKRDSKPPNPDRNMDEIFGSIPPSPCTFGKRLTASNRTEPRHKPRTGQRETGLPPHKPLTNKLWLLATACSHTTLAWVQVLAWIPEKHVSLKLMGKACKGGNLRNWWNNSRTETWGCGTLVVIL